MAIRRFALEVSVPWSYGAALSSNQFNNETVVALYRFAFLLEGDGGTAEQTLVNALTQCAPQIEQIRNEKHRIVFMVRKLRERCLKGAGGEKSPGGNPETPGERGVREVLEGDSFARPFSAMPEPERSALALFYIDLFPVREIASLLGMSFDDLSEALESGRDFLRRSGVVQSAPGNQEPT